MVTTFNVDYKAAVDGGILNENILLATPDFLTVVDDDGDIVQSFDDDSANPPNAYPF